MHMEWLQIKQVRNLQSTQISPGPRLNFFTGKNASGKTSILESTFLLARGKSFRTPRIQEVIQHGEKTLLVFARLMHEQGGRINTGLEKGYGETKIRYNGNKIKGISEQSIGVPLVLITQDSQMLVTTGPKERRHWLDWGMFHVEQDYLDVWKTYMKTLRQRNMLLKKGINKRDLYRAWEQAMIESGLYLARTRQQFLAELTAELQRQIIDIFPGEIRVKLSSNWPQETQEASAFDETWEADIRNGYTRNGAHNVDVKIQIENKNIAGIFSRGQIKLFVCLLMLAQAKNQAERTGVKPVILIDDYMAELDMTASEYLLTKLAESQFQVLLTNTEQQKVIKNKEIYKSFHVEHGRVSEIPV